MFILYQREFMMLSKICLCCEQSFGKELSVCPNCGIQDLSNMKWISDEIIKQFVKKRKPKNFTSELNEIRKLIQTLMPNIITRMVRIIHTR